MAPIYTLDVTSLVGLLQKIEEFSHKLLNHGFVALSFLHKVAGHRQQHHHIFSHAPVVIGLTTNTITNTDYQPQYLPLVIRCICKIPLLLPICNIICVQKHILMQCALFMNMPTSTYSCHPSNLFIFSIPMP